MMVAESSEASAIIAQTVVRRVGLISEKFVVRVGDRARSDRRPLRFRCATTCATFSRAIRSPFEWLDSDDPGDRSCMPPARSKATGYPRRHPRRDDTLVQPDLRKLAEALDLQTKPDERDRTTSRSSAAARPALRRRCTAAPRGLQTIMIEREAPGGQAGTSSRIENYLGFPGGVSGDDLANRALQQAKRFGTEILVTRDVSLDRAATAACTRSCSTAVERIAARAVVIATGVAWRKLDAHGATDLIGRGVYYGAARPRRWRRAARTSS